MTATRLEIHYGDRVLRCFRDRPATLSELLPAAVAANPDGEALVDPRTRLDYRQLDQRVRRLAAGLHAAGLAPGDRLAILLGNRAEFLIAALAAVRLGAVAVPLNVRLQTAELDYLLGHSGAKLLLHEAELGGRLPALRHCRRFAVGDDCAGSAPLAALETDAEPPPPPAVDPEHTAVILYTSGTTGRPKGAMLTHLGIAHSLLHYRHALGLRATDRALVCVPASHVTGLVALLLPMLQAAGCTVLQPDFKAGEFLALMEREQVSYTLMVPAMYNLCLLQPDHDRYRLAAWRIGGYGGAPMPEASVARLARWLPQLQLFNAYGATETTSPTTILPLGEAAARPDSVGRVVTCGEVVIMDDQGREVAPGESGEVWIKGPMVVPGYWHNPEATAAAFCAGYWRSGDIGALDDAGYLKVFDRLKDMVNRGGYKIYSVEVENTLNAHPAVVESALVAEPDPVLGEKTRAYVYLHEPGAADAEQLKRFCAERLSDYKVPDFLTFSDRPLPRNAGGKLLKRQLRGLQPQDNPE